MMFILKIAGFFNFLSCADVSFLLLILYQLLEVTVIFLTVQSAASVIHLSFGSPEIQW